MNRAKAIVGTYKRYQKVTDTAKWQEKWQNTMFGCPTEKDSFCYIQDDCDSLAPHC